jgi:hypothetical protein
LATFGIGPAQVDNDDDDEEEVRDDEWMAQRLCSWPFSLFWCLDDKGGEESYLSLYCFSF